MKKNKKKRYIVRWCGDNGYSKEFITYAISKKQACNNVNFREFDGSVCMRERMRAFHAL